MATAPIPTFNPPSPEPAWMSELAGVLSGRNAASPPRHVYPVENAARDAVLHACHGWLAGVGREAMVKLGAALSRAGKGYALRWDTAPLGGAPGLTARIRQDGMNVLLYELALLVSTEAEMANAIQARVTITHGDGRPVSIPFGPTAGGPHGPALLDVSADALVADVVAALQSR